MFLRAFPAGLAAALLASGCASPGPQALARDQAEYSKSLAEAEREELLRSIVNLRYGETPTLLSLKQIVAGYQVETTIDTEVFPDDDTETFIGGARRYIDRPTVTFSPVSGADYFESLIMPMQPSAIFFLINSGWSSSAILGLSVRSINGLSAVGGDFQNGFTSLSAEFREIIELMDLLQRKGALDFRMQAPKGDDAPGLAPVLWLETTTRDKETNDALARLRELLELDKSRTQYGLVYGRIGSQPDQLLVQTQSVLQVMGLLALAVQPPEEHIQTGRAFESPSVNEDEALIPFKVRHAKSKPKNAFAATKIRDYWFYIDDTDFGSKSTLSTLSLLVLMAQQETGAPNPILTIPTN